MTLKTFSPPKNASFPVIEPAAIPVERVDMHKGYPQIRPLGVTPIRGPVRLVWKRAPTATRDYVLSFIRDLDGGVGPFLWTPYSDIESPTGGEPRLSQFSSGSLPERTYYFVYTWYDSTYGETEQSARGSITVAASSMARVAVPPFPSHVEGWRLYGSETSGSEVLQATVTDSRVWSQSAALGSGASPPSSNTLSLPAKWILSPGYQCQLVDAGRWVITLEFEEYII